MEPGSVIAGADPPACKASSMDNAFKAVLLQVIGHVCSAEVDAAPEEGLDIGNRRVHKGRDK